MGLDTTHDCFHGSYRAFNVWRNKLAEVAGYQFAVPPEYPMGEVAVVNESKTGRELPLIDWGHLAPREDSPALNGEWEETPKDPLLVLLVHYDCDGYIKPEQAGPLADRLEDLIPKLPEQSKLRWQSTTEQFIKGLREAAAKGETVGFH
jgi:hypothetical protein